MTAVTAVFRRRRRAASALLPSRLHPGDLLRVGSIGLRTRKLRASLSALGIAIGIAAMVGVLGISESSEADLLSVLDRLGTNLLTVQASTGIGPGDAEAALPTTAEAMLGRIGPVASVASVVNLDVNVYRSDLVPEDQSGGITVKATDVELVETLGGTLSAGRFLDDAAAQYSTAVLGSVAAERLGVTVGDRVWIGDEWFDVIGVLASFELAQDLDRSVLIGKPAAERLFDADTSGDMVYLRTEPDRVDDVRAVIPATANPDTPDQVEVTRPSDAIEARAAASNAFTSLFLGLGAVALLVGGVGIANVMVISVLERRSEIGLRRALGATRRHVSIQFLAEALLLSALGGIGGVLIGTAVTAGYDLSQGWEVVIPPVAVVGGLAGAMAIGAIAGLYPATRAARLAPTDALRTA
jgi:putative ABC transport system permease protein